MSKNRLKNIRSKQKEMLNQTLTHLHDELTITSHNGRIDLNALAFSDRPKHRHPRSIKESHGYIDELEARVIALQDALRLAATLDGNVLRYIAGERGSSISDSAIILLSEMEFRYAACAELYEQHNPDKK